MYPALRINLRAFLGKCSTPVYWVSGFLTCFYFELLVLPLNSLCISGQHRLAQGTNIWCITHTLVHSGQLHYHTPSPPLPLLSWLSGHLTFWLLFFPQVLLLLPQWVPPLSLLDVPEFVLGPLHPSCLVHWWSHSKYSIKHLIGIFLPRLFLNIRLLYVILYLSLYLAPLVCLAHSSNSLSTSLKPPSKFILLIAFLSQAMTTPIPTVSQA